MSTKPRYRSAPPNQRLRVSPMLRTAAWSAPWHAEFALTVADGWQGLGLGRALLRRLATHAAREGLEVLDGSVLAGNEPMLALLRGLGAIFHSEGSGVHATLAL